VHCTQKTKIRNLNASFEKLTNEWGITAVALGHTRTPNTARSSITQIYIHTHKNYYKLGNYSMTAIFQLHEEIQST
jgi:hypothetical protein